MSTPEDELKRAMPEGDEPEGSPKRRKSKWDQTGPSDAGSSVLGADVLAAIAAKAQAAMANAGVGGMGGLAGGLVTMDLKAVACGGLIGKGGVTINALRAQSGAQIQIENEGDPRKVTISGTPDSVARAKQMIEEIVIKEFGSIEAASGVPMGGGGGFGGGFGGNPNAGALLAMMGGQLPGQQITENMPIPKALVGRCIGKAGSMIKQLMAESGANLSIDQNHPAGDTMIIVGSQEQCEKAKVLVDALLNRDNAVAGGTVPSFGQSVQPFGAAGGNPFAGTGGGLQEVEVALGNTLLGKIIGKGGETIRNLKTQSGVERIQLDKDAPGGPVCRITGNAEACAICAGMVQAIVTGDPAAAQVYGANSAPQGGGGGFGEPNPLGNFAPPLQQQQQYGQQAYGQQQQPQLAALPAYMTGGVQQQPQQPMMQQQQPMMQQGGMQGLPMAFPMGQQQQQPMMQQMQQPMVQQPMMQQGMMQQPNLAAPAPPPLPPVAPGSAWQIVADPTSGRNYYWNQATQQSSWEPPPEGM